MGLLMVENVKKKEELFILNQLVPLQYPASCIRATLSIYALFRCKRSRWMRLSAQAVAGHWYNGRSITFEVHERNDEGSEERNEIMPVRARKTQWASRCDEPHIT